MSSTFMQVSIRKVVGKVKNSIAKDADFLMFYGVGLYKSGGCAGATAAYGILFSIWARG